MKSDLERRAKVKEYNELRRAVADLASRLEKLEAHDGDDGTPEDVDAQVRLVDEIDAKRRRISELKLEIYPRREAK